MPFHLLDTTMFYARHGGGVKRYLFCKHAWCLRHHIQHTIVVPGKRSAQTQDDVVTIASPQIPFSGGYHFPLNLPAFAKIIEARSPDIIEAGDPYQLAWLSRAIAHKRHIPITAFYHSNLARLVALRLGQSFAPLARRYIKALYSGFDLVLAPSQTLVEELKNLGIGSAVHQPLGVDAESFSPQKKQDDIRKQLCLPPNVKILVYAGRFSKEKNIPVLLETMRLLGSNYHLLLIGSGMRIPELANVTHIRYLANSEALARILASCDALLHAGDQETFGLIILEAMACALPVIGIQKGGVAELVDERSGFLVQEAYAPLLAEAVCCLFSKDWQSMGRQGRQKVLEQYQWHHVLSLLMHKYAALLGVASVTREQPKLHIAN
jgi:alpha-1,6-mannosyltransferase